MQLGRHRPEGPPPERPVGAAPDWLPAPEVIPPLVAEVFYGGRLVGVFDLTTIKGLEIKVPEVGAHILHEMDQHGRLRTDQSTRRR